MCYHIESEVNPMEEERTEQNEQQECRPQEGYTPRPAWQVWGARIGLVIFILLVIMQYINIARGGL